MVPKPRLLRILFISGIVSFFIGTIDPLEGSVLIVLGSFLMALSSRLQDDKQHIGYALAFGLIAIGVVILFYISSLGGIGGDTGRPMWYMVFFAPYPIGWVWIIVLLIRRQLRKKRTLNSLNRA